MDLEVNKKQNRKVTIFAIVLSVISIGLLVAGFLLVSSEKVVLLQSLSNLSGKVEKLLDNNTLYDKIATSDNIGIKANINLTSDYANAGLQFNYLENKKDKKSKLDLDISMSDQDLLGLEGVLANDNLYLYVDNITSKYYYTALEYTSVLSSLKANDYDKLISLIKETFTDYINDKDIEKEKVEITYKGKTKKVNKLTYAVTNKAIADMITNFVDSLKKDKALLESISSYTKQTTEELIEQLDNFVSTLTYDEVEVGCYYNVYYYGFNKIVKYELTDASKNVVVDYKVEDKETINFYQDGTSIMSLEVTKNKGQFDFKGFIKNVEDGIEMPFNGNLKDDTLTININSDGANVRLSITSTNSGYSYKNKLALSVVSEGQEVNLGTLDIDYEYYFDEKVNADLSNSVSVEEMTEADLTVIQNNLMNHPIYQLFMSISGNLSM